MYVVLVEDDHLQADWVESCLAEAFEGLDIVRISTESAFYAWLAGVGDDRPKVFIIDVMLRWADPGPDLKEPPAEVKENGFYRAGLRCQQRISENPRLRGVPVILYTVMEALDLEGLPGKPANLTHLRKDSDPEPLIKKIRPYMR
jgi:hypothetical protein